MKAIVIESGERVNVKLFITPGDNKRYIDTESGKWYNPEDLDFLAKDDISRAVEVLDGYNEWRRGDHEPCDCGYTGTEIGAAIDFAVSVLKRFSEISRIVNTGETK